MAEAQQEGRSQFKDALVLAMIPGLAYWFAYLYELGYHKYFGIPASLIDVSLVDVLSAAAGILSTAMILKIWFDTTHVALQKLRSRWQRTLLVVLLAIAAIVWGIATVFHLDFKTGLIVGGILGVVALIFWIVPIVSAGLEIQRQERAGLTPSDAIRAVKTKYEKEATQTITSDDRLHKYLGRNGMLLLSTFILFSILTLVLGARSAQSETHFMVQKGPEAMVVLKKYGSQILIAKFDRRSKKLLGEYVLATLGDKFQLEFTYERLDGLEPASAGR